MGRWYLLEVRWTAEIPDERACADLAELLARLDHDTPCLTPAWEEHRLVDEGLRVSHLGIWGLWRKPLLALRELLSLCHAYGYPCEGRTWRWEWEPDDEAIAALRALPWVPSTPWLGWLGRDAMRHDYERVAAFSRRFARYLPPKPERRPWGCGRRGRRWFPRPKRRASLEEGAR